MAGWMTNVQMDEGLIAFKTTFADETKGEGRILHGGWPNPPEFIAQVDEDVDLRWIGEIRRRTGLVELKYRDVHRWITYIDAVLYGMMQETWGKTDIVITDPRPALDSVQAYFRPFIDPRLLGHPPVRKIMLSLAARDILFDTPLIRLANLANFARPGLCLPDQDKALPEWASPREWAARLGNNYKKARSFAARLSASYFEACDDDHVDERIRRARTDCGIFGCSIDFGKVLLELSATRRVFDEGQDSALEDVKLVRRQSMEPLLLHRGIGPPSEFGSIEPGKSALSDELQAADLAAGLAKCDYEASGIAGVLERFRAVLYNGKVIH